jgi:YesN/AraC family two-component response regulator
MMTPLFWCHVRPFSDRMDTMSQRWVLSRRAQYDAYQSVHILVSDLNVGQPGDGFTIVSALRRTQPDAIALIVTGYPAFEQALQAIREQVGDFLLKPAEPSELVQAIKSLSSSRREHVALQSKRVPEIVRENQSQLIQCMLGRLTGCAKEHPFYNAAVDCRTISSGFALR